MKFLHAILPFVLVATASGCGPGPVPVGAASYAPGDGHDHSADDGHNHAPEARAAMPQDAIHAGMTDPAAAPSDDPHALADAHGIPAQAQGVSRDDFAGVVRLRGALARVETAFLFVSVMPEGSNVPSGFDRFELGNEAVGKFVDGERLISFSYLQCAVPEGVVELKVQYDTDGYVETKDENSVTQRFVVTRGDTAIDVTLDEPSG